MRTLPLRTLALGGALACAAALAVAHASELWLDLPPCALCLWQRWPWRAAAVLGVLAALAPLRLARLVFALMVLSTAAAAVLAGLHVGVEFGWWPSPAPQCLGGRISGGSIAERLASMPLRPAKPCDEPTFLIPGLPLSMAAMNLLYAVAVTLMLVLTTTGKRRQ